MSRAKPCTKTIVGLPVGRFGSTISTCRSVPSAAVTVSSSSNGWSPNSSSRYGSPGALTDLRDQRPLDGERGGQPGRGHTDDRADQADLLGASALLAHCASPS